MSKVTFVPNRCQQSLIKYPLPLILITIKAKSMTTIKNIQPLSATEIYDQLKKEFPAYINDKLGSELAIDFADVYDVVNVHFPEVLSDGVMTVTVNENEITVTDSTTKTDYNAELIEQHLIDFMKLKAE